jgi:hypothetical protein
MNLESSPFPLEVDCNGTLVVVSGISGNSYVSIDDRERVVGLVSPTEATAENAPSELPALYAEHKALNG